MELINMSVEVIKILRISFTIKCTVAVNDDGVNVWRATSDSLKLHADGQSPDEAVRALEKAIQNAECEISRNVAKVFVPKAKKDAVKEIEEVKEESSEEVLEEVSDKAEKPSGSTGKAGKGKK
jgi:hypothetical protein